MTESAVRSSVSEAGLKEPSGPSPAVTYNIEGILGFKDFNRSQQLYNEVTNSLSNSRPIGAKTL